MKFFKTYKRKSNTKKSIIRKGFKKRKKNITKKKNIKKSKKGKGAIKKKKSITKKKSKLKNFPFRLVTSDEFKNQYCEDDRILTKATFTEEFPDDKVTDIDEYGEGEYWCVTNSCIDHYRDNPNYYNEIKIDFPPNLKIAIGSSEDYNEYDELVRKKANGFYDPDMDSYGLILF